MRPVLPLILLLFLSALGCTKQREVPEVKKEKPNQIVLIFNEPVKNGYAINPKTGKVSHGRTNKGDEIQITDDHHISRRLVFEEGVEYDTIVINSKRDQIEVMLMYKGIDDLTYLFQNGDSVMFTYEGIKPAARIMNREVASEVVNYSLFIRDSLAFDDYLAITFLQNPLLKIGKANDSELSFQEYFAQMDDESSAKVIQETPRYYDLLDKWKEAGVIDEHQYRFRLENIIRTLQKSDVALNRPGIEKKSIAGKNIKEAIEFFEARYPDIELERKDSLLYNSAYQRYLSTAIAMKYRGKIEMISREGRGAGARTLNHLQRYDSIRATDFMSPLEKKITQYNTMNAMLSQPKFFSIADRLKYLTRFKNDFNDTVMVQDLITRYNIKFQIDDEITLEDINGKSTSFSEAIAGHKGKVIYVDFWASWCAPCIREMPESKALQKELEGKDIVYLYISSDKKNTPWKKAMEKHELSQGLHYRITNGNTSKGLEDMQIMFIPRYMIYDTTGKLVNEDAPRPSEAAELKATFAKYL
jgi:thiol-disulfide isomerase/thioredoxin